MTDVPFKVHERALLELRDLKEKIELQNVQISVLQQTISGQDEDTNEELNTARSLLKALKEEVKVLSTALDEKEVEAANWKKEAFQSLTGKAITSSPEFQQLEKKYQDLYLTKNRLEEQLSSVVQDLDDCRAEQTATSASLRELEARIAVLNREADANRVDFDERERKLKAELAVALHNLADARDFVSSQTTPFREPRISGPVGLPSSFDQKPPVDIPEQTESKTSQSVEVATLREEVKRLKDMLSSSMTAADYELVIAQLSASLSAAEVNLDAAKDRIADLEAQAKVSSKGRKKG